MKKTILLFTALLLHIGFQLKAQDTLTLTLSAVTKGVLQDNLRLKNAFADDQIAKYDYRQSNNLFLPSVNVTHTGFMTNSPLMAFGTKLNQELLKQSDFNTELLNDPDDRGGFTSKIELMQPLLNLDGIAARKAARFKMELSKLQSARTLEFLQMEAAKAYMELQLAFKAVGIMEKAYQTALLNEQNITNYLNEGLAKKTDLLAVQLRVNEVSNQLSKTKNQYRNASDYVLYLMNISSSTTVVIPSEQLLPNTESIPANIELPKSRKDLEAMHQATQIYKSMSGSSRFNMLPRINMFASYELNGLDAIANEADGYMIGAQLSWSLFDGFKNIAKNQKTRAEYHKSVTEEEKYMSQQTMELQKAFRQLKDAENSLFHSKLAVEKAAESYRIYKNRYDQGMEKTVDLLSNETMVQTTELSYAEAIFTYNYMKTYIQFLTTK
ncbi:MAG: TolC family protein [Bacteroidetes bacterium]|nr:TolC family protein [Bacteroidota bacterium]